ncbi:NADH-quinone oxidoreductase subunit J [Maritalea sp.]|jgi:NADH-quinone oxidoreductase subunit J|uniref:NADH-quinone oxidoreductase subunit J n=1 Tax=Maritalea sp. TaxID=2003361 RepID=UPI0039E4568E
MTLEIAFFYLFSATAIMAAVMVISSRNPVHSVMFLILAFVNGAGIFMLAGAEFLALLLIVVYVGAVMVLFLFVVMMLDVDFAQLRQGILQYAPIGAMVGGILLVELLMVAGSFLVTPEVAGSSVLPLVEGVSNTEALGLVLYTRYVYLFEAAGLILLVAMIGAIVLTLRHKPNVKRQDIAAQVGRKREDAVEVVSVESGKGI